MDYFVTTDYHFNELKHLARPYNKRILRLHLNPAFVPTLVHAARRGRVLMIVSNADFFPAFRRTLLGLGAGASALEHITAMDATNHARIRAAAATASSVYISPLCDSRIRRLIPRAVERLEVETTLAPDSLEMLEAVLLVHS